MNWRLVLVLTAVAVMAEAAHLAVAYEPDPDFPPWANLVGAILLYGGAATLGAWSTSRLELRSPWFEALANRTPLPPIRGLIVPSFQGAVLVLGVASLIVLVLPSRSLSPETELVLMSSAWSKPVTAIWAGVVEQLVFAFAAISLVARVLTRTGELERVVPTTATMRIAIGVAAVLFALAHGNLEISTVALHFVGGCVYGWIYWHHGLECSMVAHALYDVTIFFVLPIWT